MEITIKSKEQKISSKGTPFFKVEDEQTNKYFIWDIDTGSQIEVGKSYQCVTKEKNGYVSIESVIEKPTTKATVSVPVMNKETTKTLMSIKDEHMTASVLTSYAKDVLVTLIENTEIKKENVLTELAKESQKIVWKTYKQFLNTIKNDE